MVKLLSLNLLLLSPPVINILKALEKSHHGNGLSRLSSPDGVIYKIRPRASFLTLSQEYSQFLYANLHGSMGVYLVGRQSLESTSVLFSLSSQSSVILQLISSTLNNTLRMDYRAEGSRQVGEQSLVSVVYPKRNPFSSQEWVHLAVSLKDDRLVFFVNCEEAIFLPIENKINLELEQNVIITLAGTPGRKDSKFSVSFVADDLLLI